MSTPQPPSLAQQVLEATEAAKKTLPASALESLRILDELEASGLIPPAQFPGVTLADDPTAALRGRGRSSSLSMARRWR
jgi:hypothetical protein